MRRKRSSGESFEDSEETQFEKRSTGGSNRSDSNRTSQSGPSGLRNDLPIIRQQKLQKLKL